MNIHRPYANAEKHPLKNTTVEGCMSIVTFLAKRCVLEAMSCCRRMSGYMKYSEEMCEFAS